MMENILRGLTTNHARWDVDAKDAELRPIVTTASADTIVDRIANWTSDQSRWSLVDRTDTDDARTLIRLQRKTAVFGFVDDITLRIMPSAADDDGCLIDAESQSRIGKGDLGQNRRNLRELHRVLTRLPAQVDAQR